MNAITDILNRGARRVPTWALYIAGAIPLIWIVGQLFTGGLGVDPVKAMEQQVGRTGLKFLVVGLAITPLRSFAGINLIRFRRALGLLGFFYILAHLLIWLLLDIQLLWGQIGADIVKRPYITIGMAAFTMLLPLAITSNNFSLRRMGAAAWRQLHKLTYFAVVAGGVHYVMVVKGWQLQPFVYLAIILALLALRLKWPRRRILA